MVENLLDMEKNTLNMTEKLTVNNGNSAVF